MSPLEAISSLDTSLSIAGEPAILRRTSGLGASPTNYDLALSAHVRNYSPQEWAGGVIQGDSVAIMSPSPINASGWPGAGAQTDGTDIRVPRRDDKLIVQGRTRNIEAAVPFYMAGTLVRIELQLRG